MNKTKRNNINLTAVNPRYVENIMGVYNHDQLKLGQTPYTKLSRKIGHILPRGMRK